MPATTTNPRAALRVRRRLLVDEIHQIDAKLRRLEELDPTYLRFAAGIHAARQHSGLSQAMLARLVGLHPSTIGRIERGQLKNMRATTVARLAEVLSLDLDKLFDLK
jgi:DNA-binding XRE family transcriptional regulator